MSNVIVKSGIVYQTFPADSCARLFEINPHDNDDTIADFLRKGRESFGVFDSNLRVVNRTRSDNGDDAFVFALQNAFDGLSRIKDRLSHIARRGDFILEVDGRDKRRSGLDVYILNGNGGGIHGYVFRSRVTVISRYASSFRSWTVCDCSTMSILLFSRS